MLLLLGGFYFVTPFGAHSCWQKQLLWERKANNKGLYSSIKYFPPIILCLGTLWSNQRKRRRALKWMTFLSSSLLVHFVGRWKLRQEELSDEQDPDPCPAIQQRSSDSGCSCSRTSDLLVHPKTVFTATSGRPGVLHQTRA